MIKNITQLRIYIALFVFAGLVFWSVYAVFVLNQTTIYKENGLLENAQVLILSFACLTFLLSAVHRQRNDKLLFLFFALICLSCVLRELDVEDLNVPDFLIFIGSGIGRNVILTIGFMAIFIYAAFNFAHYKEISRKFLYSKNCLLIIGAVIFLCIGSLFEKLSTVPHHVFYEEILELAGFLLVLLMAFTCSRDS